ncbi:MAG: transcriptional repressor [Bacilli bacterium]|nr:transcriptional repressor [Bacilli bacterium]
MNSKMASDMETITYKNTKGRQAILAFLRKSDYPVTAVKIYNAAKKEGINFSTVYRCLNFFVGKGLIHKEVSPDHVSLFSLASHPDKHVIVCLKCHKRVEIEGCPYEEANKALEKGTGFKIVDHNAEIYGICPECQKKASE